MMLWFQLKDEPVLAGWQSGVMTTRGKKKPAYTTFARLPHYARSAAHFARESGGQGLADSLSRTGGAAEPRLRRTVKADVARLRRPGAAPARRRR